MSYAKHMPSVQEVARTDAGLASELRIAIMRLRRRLAAERVPGNELSAGAMSVIGVLVRNGELTIGELAAAERVQPPSMTRTVTCLEQEGFVQRKPHESDKRVVVVSLTDQGHKTVQAERKRRDAWLAQRLKTLAPAERETLRAAIPILERLASTD